MNLLKGVVNCTTRQFLILLLIGYFCHFQLLHWRISYISNYYNAEFLVLSSPALLNPLVAKKERKKGLFRLWKKYFYIQALENCRWKPLTEKSIWKGALQKVIVIQSRPTARHVCLGTNHINQLLIKAACIYVNVCMCAYFLSHISQSRGKQGQCNVEQLICN